MKDNTKLKNKILVILTAITLAIFALPFSIISAHIEKTYAYTPTEVTVDNGDFSSTSTSTYPRTASNWTNSSASSNTSNIKAGVVSTVLETFKEQYKKYGLAIENTSGLENSNNLNVYMINALNTSLHYGIVSNSISLEAGSFYKITVDVKTSLPVLVGDDTMNLSSMASIYLNVGEETFSFIGIDTNNAWNTYTFYLQTNKFIAPDVTIELWLGSKTEIQSSGAVWFDNVKIKRYSGDTWNSKEDATNKIVNVDDFASYDATNKITNASFEDIGEIWELETNEENNNSTVITGIVALGDSYNKGITNIATNPLTDGNANTNYALFINNTEEAGTVFKSNTFKIEQYSNYLLEVYVKTGAFDEGGAKIELVPVNEDLDKTSFTSIETSTTASNSITNNWSKYSFYIQGSPFDDEEVYLQLSVGGTDDEDLVKGYAFFDDVTLSKIDYSKYNNASTSSTVKKAQLHNISSSGNFTNAYFNIVDDAFTGNYPLAPSGWTYSNEDNIEHSGIISTRVTDFESKTATYYGNLPWYCIGLTPLQSNTDVATAKNNLLMIHNETVDYQSYTSSTYTMTANSYYKLSINARTLTTGNAFIKVRVAGNVVKYYKFKSEVEWTTFEDYISTGFGDKEITVELGLGTSDALVSGYAFFDNVIIKDITEDVFTTAKEDGKDILDYANEDFSMITGESDNELETPSNWSTTENDLETMIGIDTSEDVNNLTIATMKATANIKTTSSISYNLDSESYYIVTFNVKTSEFKDLENSGARFGFTESNKVYFEKIINNTEDYVSYKFYVSGGSYSTITPYLELDIEDGISGQFVKLSSITIEKTTETTFTEMVTSLEDDETITDVLVLGAVTEEEDDDDNNSSRSYVAGTFEWYYIPTIITTLAFILAIIGVINNKHQKKVKKHEKQKKFTNNYDREITLHKAIIDREAQAIKKQKLDELRAKLALANEELEQLEAEYKDNIAKENTNKEHAFKKYAKDCKKVELKKEQLEAEKEYIQSEEFMQETTNKVIETYEVEAHEEEVSELAKQEQVASEEVDNNTESENATEVAEEQQSEEVATEEVNNNAEVVNEQNEEPAIQEEATVQDEQKNEEIVAEQKVEEFGETTKQEEQVASEEVDNNAESENTTVVAEEQQNEEVATQEDNNAEVVNEQNEEVGETEVTSDETNENVEVVIEKPDENKQD